MSPAAPGFRRLVFLAALAALAVLPSTGLAEPAADTAAGTLQIAPEFSRTDLNHRKVSLSDFRGKVVLLNFWATWCGPCLEEIPQFTQWQHAYAQRGLQVVGISMDDEEAPVQATYAKYRLNYPVVMGDEKLAEQFGGVYGLPVTFLIDRSGQIRIRKQGAVDLNDMKRRIESLLGPS